MANNSELTDTSEYREVTDVVWQIEDFENEIIIGKDQTTLFFNLGSAIGFPSEWTLNFKFEVDGEDNSDLVGLYLELENYDDEMEEKLDQIFVQFTIFFQRPDGTFCSELSAESSAFLATDYFQFKEPHEIVQINWLAVPHSTKNEVLVDGSIKLTCRLQMSNVEAAMRKLPDRTLLNSLWDTFAEDWLRDYQKVAIGPGNADFTISFSEGELWEPKEFTVNKAVLAVRSPFFAEKIAEDPKKYLEKDIKPKAMEIILKYFHGQLPIDIIFSKETVINVLEACQKFNIKDLPIYLDHKLVEMVTETNAMEILKVCEDFDLQNAKENIGIGPFVHNYEVCNS